MYQFHPLDNESQFEVLIKDLLNIKFKDYSSFDLYGKKGQKQFGNDIIGYNKTGKMILAQVKKKSISRKNLRAEVLKEFENEIDSICSHFDKNNINKIIFATTYKRDTILQDKAYELTNKYSVEIIYWGWDTIEDLISLSQDIQNKYFTIQDTKLLTTLPALPYCIGRENDFAKLEKLFGNENIINIQSIGGLGKSTFAHTFINMKKDFYDYIGYISVEDSLEEAFLKTFNKFFNISKNDNIDSIIYKLQSLKGKNFLIIDNLIYQKDIKFIKMLNMHFNVLITSRVLFNEIKNIELEPLNNDFLKELFYKYNNDNNDNIKDKELNLLFEYLNHHTLFIEITAKSINNNNLTIEYILEEFKSGNLPNVNVEIDLDTYEEKTYNSFLNTLFEKSMEILDDNFSNILIIFSLFPSSNLNIKDIYNISDLNLNKELLLLSKKGWLIYIDKETYKIHQIIKEFLLYNFPLRCEHVVPMIKNNLKCIRWNEVEHPKNQQRYMTFAKSLIDGLSNSDDGLIMLSNNLAMLYRYFGYFELALKYMIIVKEYDENTGDKVSLAQTYNNLGQVYSSMKNSKLAKKYNLLSLNIRKEYSSYNIQENYLSICDNAIRAENYIEAKEYLDKLLSMKTDIKSIIPIYNSAILYYLNIKDIDKAFIYVNKALDKINNGEVDSKHLYIAYTYSNISEIYIANNNLDLAIEYRLKAKEHILKNFGDTHPDLEYINKALTTLVDINKMNNIF